MKKSVEILGLPIISITEGRELGMSKSLLIDAKNGQVAAITIEDDDWYRGVKLIPYESVIAIGEDAVTITHSENILNLDEAGDYERLLVENIRVIGTKAITKTGRIQGNITEVFIGDGGKIEKCEITAPNGDISEVNAAQVSIFGKQVTVVDMDEEKKNNSVTTPPAYEPAFESYQTSESAQNAWTPAPEKSPVETIEAVAESADLFNVSTEVPGILVTPDDTLTSELLDAPQETLEAVTETTESLAEPPVTPTELFDIPTMTVEPPAEEKEPVQTETVQAETVQAETVQAEPVKVESVKEESVQAETVQAEPVKAGSVKAKAVKSKAKVEPQPSEEEQKIATMTQQAEDLRAALLKARESKQPAASQPRTSQKKQVEKAVDERRRRVLLGKHATKTITAESGTVVVEAGAEVTEEVLQRARLSNKFIELSMNVQ